MAVFLRAYQLDGGYTPGPLLALLALAGLAGSVLALIRRAAGPAAARSPWPACCSRRPPRSSCSPPDVYEFSWRYQLPAVITLVPAGALGLSAPAEPPGPGDRPPPAPSRWAAGWCAGRRDAAEQGARRSVPRSRERANVRAQRRSVAPA